MSNRCEVAAVCWVLVAGCQDIDAVKIGIGDAVVGDGVDTDAVEEVDGDTDPPVDTGDSDQSSDTGRGPDAPVEETGLNLVVPTAFSFTALFAYDPVTDQAVPFFFSNGGLGPLFDVRLGSEAYFLAGASDEGCLMEFMQPFPQGRAPWASTQLFAMELDRTLSMVTNCEGVFSSKVIGELEAFIRNDRAWGVGIDAPPMATDVAAAAAGSGVAGFAVPGGFALSAPPMDASTYDATGALTLGFQIGADWRVIEDPAGNWFRMSDSDMVVGGQLQRGLYSISVLFFFPLP